jgi:hypothetical protein
MRKGLADAEASGGLFIPGSLFPTKSRLLKTDGTSRYRAARIHRHAVGTIYVTRISPPAPRDHRPSSGIGFLRRRRVLVELRSSDGTRQRPIHAGSLLSRAVPTPRDLHHSTVRYPVKRYLCRRGCRRWSLGRRDSRSHWERVMKLGPNARTRCRTGPVPSPLRPATAAANRGSHRISGSRYCSVVPLSGEPCEPSRRRNESFPFGCFV